MATPACSGAGWRGRGYGATLRLPVLGREEQLGERFERDHELVELVRLEALVGLRGEVVRERLDPLFDGAARFAQPTVVSDQVTITHPVDHRGELASGEVLDAPEPLRGNTRVEGEEDVRLQAADTLAHQGGDVPVATVLAQQG